MSAFRPLNLGAQSPPLRLFKPKPDLMRHKFTKRPQPNVAGAYEYSYDTLGVQKQSLVGAGTGFRTGAPLGYGQKPFVAEATVGRQGLAFSAGQMFNTPLSDPSDKA